MPVTSPYFIKHVQLADKVVTDQWASLKDQSKRYYIVLWWNEIALGDLYIEASEIRNIQEKIAGAILPALTYYAGDKEAASKIITFYNQKDFLSFDSALFQLLHNYLTNDLPQTVAISVVVCTRNRSECLKKCLDSLTNQHPAPEEIIVIDNAPTDDSTEKVVKQYASVIYYKESHKGLDIARNSGAYLAKHPIVAYTDDDVCVDKLWSYRVWETFKDESVKAMTGLVIVSELETESQQIFEKHWGFNKGYQDIYFDAEFLNEIAPKVWSVGAGANMAFRKSAIEAVKYFDDRLDVGAAGCSGDSEMWFKLLHKGLKIHYNPKAIAYHAHRKQMKQLQKQLFGYVRGHAAAALIQHEQNNKAGYRIHIFKNMPKYYIKMLLKGFPNYGFRYRTLWSEIKGLVSGIIFYYKNRKLPSYTCKVPSHK